MFVAIMEGRNRAAEYRRDEQVAQAWHTANLGRAKTFPRLKVYLDKLKPMKPAEDGSAMLAALQEIQERSGAKMTFRKVD